MTVPLLLSSGHRSEPPLPPFLSSMASNMLAVDTETERRAPDVTIGRIKSNNDNDVNAAEVRLQMDPLLCSIIRIRIVKQDGQQQDPRGTLNTTVSPMTDVLFPLFL